MALGADLEARSARPRSSRALPDNEATLAATGERKANTFSSANPAFTAAHSGRINGDTTSVLGSGPAPTTSAGPHTPLASHPAATGRDALSSSTVK